MRGLWRITRFLRALRYGKPKRIISLADIRGRPGTKWYHSVDPDLQPRRDPRRFGHVEADFSRMVEPIPELGVIALPNGRALGPKGWAFTAHGEVIRETTWYGPDLAVAQLPAHFDVPRRLTGACLCLISEFSTANYGHYVLDCLSRIGIATQAGLDLSKIDYFYLNEPPSSSALYLLEKLGIDVSHCIWANKSVEIVADTLLVTTFPGTRRNYARIVPQTLGNPFAACPSGNRRIYVPRSGVRKVINSAEIETISREFGLEVYDFQTVDNEFEYFHSADLVAGSHGAGLTNIAVCRTGTKILELVPSDHVYPYYYTLAESAGLDYNYIVGESSEHRPPGSWGPSLVDFHVDAEDYRQALTVLTEALLTRNKADG